MTKIIECQIFACPRREDCDIVNDENWRKCKIYLELKDRPCVFDGSPCDAETCHACNRMPQRRVADWRKGSENFE